MKRKQLYLLSLAFLGLMSRSNAQCAFNYLGPVDSLSHISFGESEYEAMAVDPSTNTPYVAYRDGNNFYGTSVKKYVAGKWVQVGSTDFTYGATSSEVYDNAITVDKHGIPYVACEDKGYANHCAVFMFNGTTWDTLPGQIAGFTSPAQYISITTDTNGIPYVAYQNVATAKMNVQMYNALSGQWVPVGTSVAVSKGQAQYCQIAFDRVHNVPYVAYEDGFKPNHADHLMVQYFNGTNWVVPGVATVAADTAGITTDTVNYVSLTMDKKGNAIVAYEDFSSGKNIGIMMFDSATSTWSADTNNRTKYLGGPVNYVSAGVDSADNVYVAYQDMSYYGYDGLSIVEYTASKNSVDFVGSYKVSQSISASDANFISLAVSNHGVPMLAYEDKGVGDHAQAFQWSSTLKQWTSMSTTGISNMNPGTWNGMAGYTAIATSPTTNDPYIAYRDANTSNKATVMMYSSGAWASVGAPGSLSLGSVKFTTLGFDAAGEPICMFTDDGAVTKYSISCMKYTSGAWAAVGTNSATLSGGNCYYPAMTIVNDTVYAAYELGDYHMSVMKCAVSGSTWTNVGPADVNGDSASYQSIAVDKNGNVYVAFSDNAANQNGISVMEYTSTGWNYVGTRNFSGGKSVYPSIKINPLTNMPVVAYSSYGAGTEANVEEWNGSAWVFVGAPGFSTDWTSYMSLAVDNNGAYYVSYDDWGNEVSNQGQYNVTVEKFDTKVDTAWRVLPLGGGSCSQNGASSEQCTLDASGNLYVVYASYSAFVQELNCPTGINEINGNNNNQVSVFPNPNHGSFTVAVTNAPKKSYITVFDVLGQNIYQTKLTSDKTEINLGTQAPGMYLYRVLDENGNAISTGKLIIK